MKRNRYHPAIGCSCGLHTWPTLLQSVCKYLYLIHQSFDSHGIISIIVPLCGSSINQSSINDRSDAALMLWLYMLLVSFQTAVQLNLF